MQFVLTSNFNYSFVDTVVLFHISEHVHVQKLFFSPTISLHH
jgi:hypothetical protein